MVTARRIPTEYESYTVTIGVRRLIGMWKSFRQTVWLRLPATTRRSLPPLYAPALISKGHSLCRLAPTLGIWIWNWICLNCTRTVLFHLLPYRAIVRRLVTWGRGEIYAIFRFEFGGQEMLLSFETSSSVD